MMLFKISALISWLPYLLKEVSRCVLKTMILKLLRKYGSIETSILGVRATISINKVPSLLSKRIIVVGKYVIKQSDIQLSSLIDFAWCYPSAKELWTPVSRNLTTTFYDQTTTRWPFFAGSPRPLFALILQCLSCRKNATFQYVKFNHHLHWFLIVVLPLFH